MKKKYMVRTENGVVVCATNSMLKAVAWVVQNCELIDAENDVFALPNGVKVEYVINENREVNKK